MLPKHRRIERKQFSSVLSDSKRYNSTSFYLSVALAGAVESKFSFSVSKKVVKEASGRNKLRRRGYSIVIKHLKRIKPGFLCFFSYKKGYNKNVSLLEEEIIMLLSKATVLE